MRFSEYLRTTVLLVGTTGLALLLIAAGAILRDGNLLLLVFTAGWTLVSVLTGLWLGRRGDALESIRTLLSRSRPEPVFPMIAPGAVLLGRLWPILVIALVSVVGSLWLPSLPIVGGGYGLIWSLAWRKQALAVEAIEERDAVHFWVVRTAIFKQIKIVRVPAM